MQQASSFTRNPTQRLSARRSQACTKAESRLKSERENVIPSSNSYRSSGAKWAVLSRLHAALGIFLGGEKEQKFKKCKKAKEQKCKST